MVWKQVMLMRRFGTDYPRPKAEQDAFFRDTPKAELSKLALSSLDEPLTASGIDTSRMRLGTFFTRNGSNAVPGAASYACPNELLRWLVKMEQGKMVDEWSSLEIKRLMYFVRPAIPLRVGARRWRMPRYFSNRARCSSATERRLHCKQYAGNVTNLMHSVAAVESGEKRYLIAMMSNVLRVNSAVEHQTIAGEDREMIQGRPGAMTPPSRATINVIQLLNQLRKDLRAALVFH